MSKPLVPGDVVRLRNWPGYDAMMIDAIRGEVADCLLFERDDILKRVFFSVHSLERLQ